VFKDNEISRGFITIRFLTFLYGNSLRNFSHVRLMKVDLFIIQLGNRTEFYEKAKTLAERKGIGQNSSTESFVFSIIALKHVARNEE